MAKPEDVICELFVCNLYRGSGWRVLYVAVYVLICTSNLTSVVGIAAWKCDF